MHSVFELGLLWNGVLSCLDLGEEFLWHHVIERELSIQHGEKDNAQRPHVAGLTQVRLSYNDRHSQLRSHKTSQDFGTC